MRRCWILLLLPALLFTSISSADELPWFEIEIIIFIRDIEPASQSEKWPEYPGTPNFANVRPLQPGTAPGIRLPDELLLDTEGNGEEVISQIETNLTSLGNALEIALPVPGTTSIDPTMISIATAEKNSGQTLGLLPETPENGDLIPEEQTEETTPDGPQPPVPYALIPEEEYRLTSAFRRLKKASYTLQPVVHLAWRQPVTNRKQSELLYVRALEKSPDILNIMEIIEPQAPTPPKLEGTLQISVNRYLHVQLDLLRYIEKTPSYLAVDEFPENGLIIETSAFNSYRMQSRRRMRSGELHYLDHPLMGALIQITPYKLPEIIPETIPEAIIETEVQAALPATDTAQPATTTAPPIEPAVQIPTANP